MGLAILRAAGCGSVFAGCGLKQLRAAGQIAGLTNFLWKFVQSIAFDKTLTLFILPSFATNDEQSLIKTLPIRVRILSFLILT